MSGNPLTDTFNRAIAAHQSGNISEAEFLYRTILSQQKNHFDALHMLGVLQGQKQNFEEAEKLIGQALKIHQGAQIYANHARTLLALKRYKAALEATNHGLSRDPKNIFLLNMKGATCLFLKNPEMTIECCETALRIQPNFAPALSTRGSALLEMGRFPEALASYDQALASDPNDAEAHYNRGYLFMLNRAYDEALVSFDRAMKINPDIAHLMGCYIHTKMQLCNWLGFDSECARIVAAVRAGRRASPPYALFAIPSSPNDQLMCSQIYVAGSFPASAEPIWRGEPYAHDRIRVAYVSADFREHPVSQLLVDLIEKHDRAHFEIIAISHGPDDQSLMRNRLKGAFDRFIDVNGNSDRIAGDLMHELEIDIAVDLMGFTTNCRPGIFANRPAPIAVNYLGYSGTTGAGYIDYVLADKFVIPEAERSQFSEHVVYLPDTFLGHDSKKKMSGQIPARRELGLPETGFVFCAFNNAFKITPQVFDVWMRLLRAIEGSVLWLSHTNATAMNNLRREAQARGVDSNRQIFAPRLPRLEDHLARHRQANLFLDTLPYNAHTTASDALWAGLPVLTCPGETFAGRVAASLLQAVGLPELVTTNLNDYEALALKLARNPSLLAEIRAKLERTRETYPLFDTVRYTSHLEAAYTTMWEKWQRGEAPTSFSVEPLAPNLH